MTTDFTFPFPDYWNKKVARTKERERRVRVTFSIPGHVARAP